MATVLNRTTLEILQSVNTPDYDPADWIVDPDLSAIKDVPKKYWKVVGDSVVEMDATEKVPGDATDFLVLKYEKIYALKRELEAYIGKHYSDGQQKTLIAFLAEAASDGKPTRRDYIKKAVDWVQTCLEHLYAKKAEVEAAATVDDVNAVALDLGKFDSTDPVVTVPDVLAITN